jgi:hypothetical protein
MSVSFLKLDEIQAWVLGGSVAGLAASMLSLGLYYFRPEIGYFFAPSGDSKKKRVVVANFERIRIDGLLLIEIRSYGAPLQSVKLVAGPWKAEKWHGDASYGNGCHRITICLRGLPAEGGVILDIETEGDVELGDLRDDKDAEAGATGAGRVIRPRRFGVRSVGPGVSPERFIGQLLIATVMSLSVFGIVRILLESSFRAVFELRSSDPSATELLTQFADFVTHALVLLVPVEYAMSRLIGYARSSRQVWCGYDCEATSNPIWQHSTHSNTDSTTTQPSNVSASEPKTAG